MLTEGKRKQQEEHQHGWGGAQKACKKEEERNIPLLILHVVLALEGNKTTAAAFNKLTYFMLLATARKTDTKKREVGLGSATPLIAQPL